MFRCFYQMNKKVFNPRNKLVTCLASNNSESIPAFPKHFSKVTNQCSGLFISSKMSSGGMVNFEDKRRADIGGPASSHGR